MKDTWKYLKMYFFCLDNGVYVTYKWYNDFMGTNHDWLMIFNDFITQDSIQWSVLNMWYWKSNNTFDNPTGIQSS